MVEQVREGISRDEVEGNFREQGLPFCIQFPTKRSQYPPVMFPVRDYSNAERMLAATGFTPPFVNLESITAEPRVDGRSKNCVAWKV